MSKLGGGDTKCKELCNLWDKKINNCLGLDTSKQTDHFIFIHLISLLQAVPSSSVSAANFVDSNLTVIIVEVLGSQNGF